MTPDEYARFAKKFEIVADGCWIWTAAVTQATAKRPNGGGYGLFNATGKTQLAHRLSYVHHAGPIPDGMTIDHTCHRADGSCPGGRCHHRACVNPTHLEPVTQRTNNRRGMSITAANAKKDECKNGHPFDEANTYVSPSGGRACRTCRRARTQRWYDEQGGAAWHQNYHQTVRKPRA